MHNILKKTAQGVRFIINFLIAHLVDYPTPSTLNYFWAFGSLAGVTLVIQIISGVALTGHYDATEEKAFDSVQIIMRQVNYGWLIRYTHSNGASVFFICTYIHMARGLYYSSFTYPRVLVWHTGVIIFILMMIAAFTGYVLPWGQMSFWGVTVITNLITTIPKAGPFILDWVLGGYSVGEATLGRMYTVHINCSFVIILVVILHIALLHNVGSNNPMGIDHDHDNLAFYPYYFSKDLFALSIYFFFFALLVFFYPNYLSHPDNYIPANPLVTPKHIVPEWYFLPFYAILRSCPDKFGGVISMVGAVLVLFAVPHLYTPNSLGPRFKPLYMISFWLFVCSFLWLGHLGGLEATDNNLLWSKFWTLIYFSFFFICMPVCSKVDTLVYEEFCKQNSKAVNGSSELSTDDDGSSDGRTSAT